MRKGERKVRKNREGKEDTRGKEEKGQGNKTDKRAGSKKSGKEKEKKGGQEERNEAEWRGVG